MPRRGPNPPSLCVVAIGSNIDPEHNVPLALTCLLDSFRVHDVSRFYQTDPWGPPGQPDYWNGAVLIETHLERRAMVRALRRIERLLGRRRSDDRYAPRPIDLDVVAWDGKIDAAIHPQLAACLGDLGMQAARIQR